ncbi:MAG: carbonic anhydrase [Desulfovibrionaceae bacterium]
MKTILDDFKDGFLEFQRVFYQPQDLLFSKLKQKQEPKVLIISCSDSRVDPALLFNCNPGDIFVVRNVANIVPPAKLLANSVGAALQYGVTVLQIEHIIVLGHARCGGIRALQDTNNGAYIETWASTIFEAKTTVDSLHFDTEEERLRYCEYEALKISYSNVLTFPFIIERMEKDLLQVHAWFFDIESGELSGLNYKINSFERIV